MESTERRNVGWLLIAGWIGLNTVSLLLAWGGTMLVLSLIVKVVGDTIQVAGQTRITEDYLAMYVILPLLGLLTGLLQYLILRRFIPRIGWWILATFMGWMIPFIMLRVAQFIFPSGIEIFNKVLTASLLLALAGAFLGLVQWVVLKSKVSHSGWWILFSLLGWGLTGLVVGATISDSYDFFAILLLPALVTGLGLWLLLNRLPGRQTG